MFVEITDLVIRLPALGILGLLFCVMWKQRGHSLAVKLALALIASVFFLTLSNSTLFPDVTAPQRIVLRLLDAPNVVFLWLFVRSLFEDRFKITNWDYAIGGIYIALMVWERLGEA
ncbi:MAG: hypothetical protein ACPGVT_06525, partial [Maricaulaceae bacterium]